MLAVFLFFDAYRHNNCRCIPMNTFQITYSNMNVPVYREEEDLYVVTLPGKTLYLLRKEDNEGASHWFEEGADNETPETLEIGIAIERAVMSFVEDGK
jgi:hypothetical protein